MQLPPRILEQVRELARGVPGVERVWLFGSRARDEAAARSDIDLAVECPGSPAAEFARLSLRLSELDTLLPVDVVRLDEAGEAMRDRIRHDGILLYER